MTKVATEDNTEQFPSSDEMIKAFIASVVAQDEEDCATDKGKI